MYSYSSIYGERALSIHISVLHIYIYIYIFFSHTYRVLLVRSVYSGNRGWDWGGVGALQNTTTHRCMLTRTREIFLSRGWLRREKRSMAATTSTVVTAEGSMGETGKRKEMGQWARNRCRRGTVVIPAARGLRGGGWEWCHCARLFFFSIFVVIVLFCACVCVRVRVVFFFFFVTEFVGVGVGVCVFF